ncbi:ATP-binding protein [Dubosiella newyorkensis]|uniref:AAA family ATPase n=1 Tax=Dubosiella newyorkensis TaxID=1862672 RepID=A0A1U7NLS0_9FIRM|nr:ATP-binding protein [Dubosiella newyorkensis]OLU45813.1 AAA family ATPase [Dubosiella newyorkensis]
MKKKSVLNLIKYHFENNEKAFRSEAYSIAKEFSQTGNQELAQYIMTFLSSSQTWIPMETSRKYEFLNQVEGNGEPLLLPELIMNEIMGIANAANRNMGVNKFLFEGKPGTGKTEASKQLGRILNRPVYSVSVETLIDSKLGQTSKNISKLFKEINQLVKIEPSIVLIDEIDSFVSNRMDQQDVREMSRVTSTILKQFDQLDYRATIIGTTNLLKQLDKALVRRFDKVVSFDQYTKQDRIELAEKLLNRYLAQAKITTKNLRLFKKILDLNLPETPAELKNIIRTAIAFSDPQDESDYLVRLYSLITEHSIPDAQALKEQGFTIRESEVLLQISRSTINRELRRGQ